MVRENSWNSQRIPADGTQGMAFDRHTATIVVTVTDNNGVLAATRTVENSLDFTNCYTAEGDYAGLVLSKTLNGRDMDQGEFTFHIAGTNDAAAALLGGDGTRTFVNSEPVLRALRTRRLCLPTCTSRRTTRARRSPSMCSRTCLPSGRLA